MPLTAWDPSSAKVIDAVTDEGGWVLVYRQTNARLECRGCRGELHAKRSHRGTRFFAHTRRPVDCPWVGESARHLELKALAIDGFAAGGWLAEAEAVGLGWRADVLATDPQSRRQIAIEIQCAQITRTEVEARTAAHARSGVDLTVWVTPRRPHWRWVVPTLIVDENHQVVESIIAETRSHARWGHPKTLPAVIRALTADGLVMVAVQRDMLQVPAGGKCLAVRGSIERIDDLARRQAERERARAAAIRRQGASRARARADLVARCLPLVAQQAAIATGLPVVLGENRSTDPMQALPSTRWGDGYPVWVGEDPDRRLWCVALPTRAFTGRWTANRSVRVWLERPGGRWYRAGAIIGPDTDESTDLTRLPRALSQEEIIENRRVQVQLARRRGR